MALQKPFRGLLSYLGELSGGQISFEPSQLMQLVVDAQDFLEPPEIETASEQISPVTDEQVVLFTVPQSQVWRLMHFSVNAGQNTLWTTSLYALEYFNEQTGVGYPLGSIQPLIGKGGALTIPLSFHPGRPGLWLRSGDQLAVRLVESGGSGNGNLQGQVIFQRLTF